MASALPYITFLLAARWVGLGRPGGAQWERRSPPSCPARGRHRSRRGQLCEVLRALTPPSRRRPDGGHSSRLSRPPAPQQPACRLLCKAPAAVSSCPSVLEVQLGDEASGGGPRGKQVPAGTASALRSQAASSQHLRERGGCVGAVESGVGASTGSVGCGAAWPTPNARSFLLRVSPWRLNKNL